MDTPVLVMVVGCNAAGKSTFIRSRLNELQNFEILMTDVYKGRTKELAKQAIKQRKNIIVETVFNDASFKDLADLAREAGYRTSLVVLFLDTLQQSMSRVAFRGVQQSGITITSGNVKINFNESFKNVATCFFYFDRSDFIYTGGGMQNRLVMSFTKLEPLIYTSNDFDYVQKFANYSFQKEKLSEDAYKMIKLNKDFENKFALAPSRLFNS